jgi:hypothetical protein
MKERKLLKTMKIAKKRRLMEKPGVINEKTYWCCWAVTHKSIENLPTDDDEMIERLERTVAELKRNRL